MPNMKPMGAAWKHKSVGASFLNLDVTVFPGNWAYADVPGTEPILDGGDLTHNPPTGLNRGASQWAYPLEPTTEPILDSGDLTHNPPSGLAHGWDKAPYNAQARGLATRGDKKIKKPWVW